MQLFELFGCHIGGGLGHQAAGLLGLGQGEPSRLSAHPAAKAAEHLYLGNIASILLQMVSGLRGNHEENKENTKSTLPYFQGLG